MGRNQEEIKMGRKASTVTLIVLALVLTLMIPVSARSTWAMDKRIPGFHMVKKLSETMVAGSTYDWEVSFVNPKSESGFADITLEIVEEKTLIGLSEFMVEGTLEVYDNPPREHYYSTITFEETEGGIFQSQTPIEKRFNRITLRISSVPNLMPGTYTFTLTVTLTLYKD